MEFKQQYAVALDSDTLWTTLMDVHKVAACLDGVERLDVLNDDRYEGTLAVKMGPVRLKFNGEVNVTLRDGQNRIGILEANARDAKAGGGFKAQLHMQLSNTENRDTQLDITLNTTFLGRLGELGRPLIKKKINAMLDDFVDALNRQYVTEESGNE